MTAPAPDLHIEAFAGSHVGRVRKGNEDSYLAERTIFAVADGMGGHVAGEVASATALTPLVRLDGREFDSAEEAEQALAQALEVANKRVVDKAETDPQYRGMGTTLTAVMVREGRLHVAHVGDSRAYLLRDGEPISQLTTDHTLVERLVQEGRLSREEAARHPQRNVITRAIGHERTVAVDQLPPLQLQPGDQVLLCSDGLTGPVTDAEIADVLERHTSGHEAVRELIRTANDAGGPDNITVVLLRVTPDRPDTAATGADAPEERRIRQISTREESGTANWAETMGRIGAPQGVDRRPQPGFGRGGRARRIVAGLFATLVLAAIVVGGGWFLLSRAYFVGAHEDQVAIFNGLPQDVGGVSLYWVLEDEVTDLRLDEFPEFRQQEIREGLSAGTLAEARRIVEQLEAEAGPDEEQDADPAPTEAGEPRPRRQRDATNPSP